MERRRYLSVVLVPAQVADRAADLVPRFEEKGKKPPAHLNHFRRGKASPRAFADRRED
jgi:hypothetical protein